MFEWLKSKKKAEYAELANMMQAAAAGEKLISLRACMATLGVSLEVERDAAVGHAAGELARRLLELSGSPLDDTDGLCVAGLFAFTAANHFSYLCGASFEVSATLSVMHLVDHNDVVAPVLNQQIIMSYNKMSQISSKTIEAIGKAVENWERMPSHENFEKLSKLFGICFDHARD